MNNKTNQSVSAPDMDKQALRVFGGLAIIIYGIALAYCYNTNHLFEAGVIGAVMLGLGMVIGSMYKSIGSASKKQITETTLKQAA